MFVITAAEAPRFELPGTTFTSFASPSRGSAGLATWRLTLAPGLESDQSHTLDRDEVFMVSSGQVRFGPEGPVLSAGDAVVVPAGQPIQVANPGPEPAEVFVAIAAGFTATMADGTAVATPPWAC
jgi:mannose-6-phosphate isomerase-like protein (cupin superfamily)